MNKFGKFLLVVTSLSPILIAYAVNSISKGDKVAAYYFVLFGIGFSIICPLILWYCKTQISVEVLKIKKVTSVDKQAIAFLVIYLMPLFADNTVDFGTHPWTAAYIVLTIGMVIYHSNAFTFNPLLALLGYHFYEVESEDGMTYLLVTRKLLNSTKRKEAEPLSTVSLGVQNVLLPVTKMIDPMFPSNREFAQLSFIRD